VIGTFEIWFRRLRRRFSPSESAIRRFRLPPSEGTATEPGLLVIQIDGLSRVHFERALHRGRMPTLRRLMRLEDYQLRSLYSGLPSTTAAVQGELFYGVKCAVPAFGIYDRRQRQIRRMFSPERAQEVEARLAEQGAGLLVGGVSYSNIYTGGATESRFCAASLGWGGLFRSGTILSALVFFLLRVPAAVRMLGLLVVELGLAVRDMFHRVLRRGEAWFELKFIFTRAAVCVALREFIVAGAQIDLARGVPIVFVNFLGFDEQAHRRGPNSAFAQWSLKGIDWAIARLLKAAHASDRRDYRIWILSDHGQEQTRPYAYLHGHDLESAVLSLLEQAQRSPRRRSRRDSSIYWFGGPLLERSRQRYESLDHDHESDDPAAHVADMGPVAHVYLRDEYTSDERRELARKLIASRGVPVVLLATEQGVEWISRAGVQSLAEGVGSQLPQTDAWRQAMIEDLTILATHREAGDLTLLGWTPDHPPVSFATEHGAHGGPGPHETEGFVLLPNRTRLPDEAQQLLRPMHLRSAALHLLERERLPPPVSAITAAPSTLRVLTYNIHSCLGMDGKLSPRRIARIIESMEPDVVALQEVDLGRARSGHQDQAKLIADELAWHFQFCPTLAEGRESYGHAIISREPVEVIKRELYPKRSNGGEARGALWVRLQRGDRIINILNTHFGLSPRERIHQTNTLLSERWLGGIPASEAIVLCGDFNMGPRSKTYAAICRRLRDVYALRPASRPAATFFSRFPISRLDHVFVSPHFAVTRTSVVRNQLTRVASDHLPLVVDLQLNCPASTEEPRKPGDSASTVPVRQ
jgi:endonuclease/exonuclease/phosphatase family metal-dependent hydrolase